MSARVDGTDTSGTRPYVFFWIRFLRRVTVKGMGQGKKGNGIVRGKGEETMWNGDLGLRRGSLSARYQCPDRGTIGP